MEILATVGPEDTNNTGVIDVMAAHHRTTPIAPVMRSGCEARRLARTSYFAILDRT